METVCLPVSHIFARKDARPIDDGSARSLMASIREIGVINPIRVRRAERYVEGVLSDAYEVTAGNHRLFVSRKLGIEEIPCVVVDDDDLHAELAMIDENLCRAELSPADRAKQTARRKAIYEELHPQTKHGGDRRSDQVADFATRSFVAETADISGKAERTVRLDAERGEKVCEEALDLIRGTALDTGLYLDRLKKVDASEQVAAVQKALAGLLRQQERDRAEAIANRNKSRVESDVKSRAAQEVAEILAQNVPTELWDGLKANLFAAGAANIASAFTNLAGLSVMDRRFA